MHHLIKACGTYALRIPIFYLEHSVVLSIAHNAFDLSNSLIKCTNLGDTHIHSTLLPALFVLLSLLYFTLASSPKKFSSSPHNIMYSLKFVTCNFGFLEAYKILIEKIIAIIFPYKLHFELAIHTLYIYTKDWYSHVEWGVGFVVLMAK